MSSMKRILKNKKGEGYIDVAVSVVVIMTLIVLAINVFSFLAVKQDMDYMAREMVKSASVNGKTYSYENYQRYYELGNETGIYPSYSWSAEYHKPSDYQVQYGDTMRITLSYNTYVEGFGVFRIPITLTASYSGLSQKYWK